MRSFSSWDSPIGRLYPVAEKGNLTVIHIGDEDFFNNEPNKDALQEEKNNPVLLACIKQLEEYFNKTRITFDLPLASAGTSFQQDVWKQLRTIPYGETRSYQEVAEGTGRPKAVRAVGQANKANKFPIIIPCHRVIGKNNTLTGYAGSRTNLKEILLMHEQSRMQ